MMQRYKSHKVVEAGKITRVHTVLRDGPAGTQVHVVDFVEVGGQQYDVPEGFSARARPQVGDYLVRYPDSDGYLSWSPAAQFERGNALIEERKMSIDEIQATIGRGDYVFIRPDGVVEYAQTGGIDWSALSQEEKNKHFDAVLAAQGDGKPHPIVADDDDVQQDGSVDAGALETQA